MGNSREELLKEILRDLNNDDAQKVVLRGKSGVGKTWMAREVCRRALQQRSSYVTFWFAPEDYLSRRRVPEDDERRVVENVAVQLSVYSFNENCEDDSKVWEREGLDDLKQIIHEKLEAMKSAVKVAGEKDGKPDESSSAIAEPKETPKSNQGAPTVASQEKEKTYILVVLDALATKDRLKIMGELGKLLTSPKYLITDTDGHESMEQTGSEIQNGNEEPYVHHMKGLSVRGSLNLLKSRLKGDVTASVNFEKLCSAIRSHEPGSMSDLLLPSMMVMLAEALNNAPRHTFEGVDHEECIGEWTLESAVEEAAGIFGSGDINKMVTFVYEMFPRNGAVTHCSWHSRHLFCNARAMHSNELITHWLLEGYFGDLEQIGTAFKEGHRTLMDLKDRGVLKERENSFIYLEGAEAKLHDRRHGAFHSTSRLGLADVMKDAEGWSGLGRTTLADGLLKTSYKKKEEISTLIIDGVSHLWRKFPGTYLSTMRRLRNLVMINPTFKELAQGLEEIQVLVLRGCSALVNVDELGKLEKLLVLEISGASLLVGMKDDLFGKLEKIRCVNLSGAGFKGVPSTLMERKELRWLILRDCKRLEELPSLEPLEKLEVLDFSGSCNLRSMPDKKLFSLTELQTLNLCQTKVNRLPYFGVLPKLSRLLLSECPLLAMLTKLKPLNALEILDLSGAKTLKDVDDCLKDNTRLRVLDLSGSAVTKIPENMECLTHLLLKDCPGLKTLPSTKNMGNLQVLDLSGASSLVEISDFHDAPELRDLILSGTKITKLPKFGEGCKLRRLLLKNCICLTELPDFEAFKSLEVLDLSGCSSLEIKGLSFKHMSSLKILYLSGTKLRSLPLDCFPSSPSQLIIRDCADPKELPATESIKGTKICIQDLYYMHRTKAPGVYHDHPLEIFVGEDTGSGTCASCGSDESGEFIGCVSCQVFCHTNCFQFPEILRCPSHNPDHTLALFSDIGTQRQCQSCSSSLDDEIYYHCTSCEFFVHAGCAFQVNAYFEKGMSAKIELSWHKHPLLLCHRTQTASYGCSYCRDQLIGPTYVCEEKDCRFLLHKRCTEIKSMINHPHHPDHQLTLCERDDEDRLVYFCIACDEITHGLNFSCDRCLVDLHVKCAARFPTHQHYLHEHKLLRFEKNRGVECNRCGRSTDSPFFRCVACDFNLHEECMELPHVVKSKIHWHPLTLHKTFIEDDSGEYYCEHCEETRDHRLGAYVCGQCKLRIPRIYHIECVLPELKKVNEKKCKIPEFENLIEQIADKKREVRTLKEKLKEAMRELDELVKSVQ